MAWGYMRAGESKQTADLVSLIPLLSSDSEMGVSVSYSPMLAGHPAYFACDGTIPPQRTIGSINDYTCICSQGGDLDFYVTFDRAVKVYYINAVYITCLPWHIGAITTIEATNDTTSDTPAYTNLMPEFNVNHGDGTVCRSFNQDVTPYKKYHLHFTKNFTSSVGIAEIQFFGKQN